MKLSTKVLWLLFGKHHYEEGQRNALAELESSVTLLRIYAVTTSSHDARERSIELAGST